MSPSRRPRYVFADFVVSPSRRTLLQNGREVALIPRYFDLLVLLVERRNEAVTRRQIFDAVWSDVVVSDGALSQAVRALRRALGDDPREPAFIRTVSRHGYRFVFPEVVEQPDDGPLPSVRRRARPRCRSWRRPSALRTRPSNGCWRPALSTARSGGRRRRRSTLSAPTRPSAGWTGTKGTHGHARSCATRAGMWRVPAPVPILGQPGLLATTGFLLWLRLRRTVRLAGGRWAGAAAGGALTGLVAGFLGGLALRFGPGSLASESVPLVLGLVGLTLGGLGAIGVGAGLAAAEVLARSFRGLALVVFGAVGRLRRGCGRAPRGAADDPGALRP